MNSKKISINEILRTKIHKHFKYILSQTLLINDLSIVKKILFNELMIAQKYQMKKWILELICYGANRWIPEFVVLLYKMDENGEIIKWPEIETKKYQIFYDPKENKYYTESFEVLFAKNVIEYIRYRTPMSPKIKMD